VKKILKKGRRIKEKGRARLDRERLGWEWKEDEMMLVMVQMLIPLGLSVMELSKP